MTGDQIRGDGQAWAGISRRRISERSRDPMNDPRPPVTSWKSVKKRLTYSRGLPDPQVGLYVTVPSCTEGGRADRYAPA